MKFGLKNTEYHFILNEIIIPLQNAGAEVFCFGSRATGNFKEFSDLDLLIEHEPSAIKPLLGQLREKLEESNFPYKVDLVLWSETPLSYRAQILKEKQKFSTE